MRLPPGVVFPNVGGVVAALGDPAMIAAAAHATAAAAADMSSFVRNGRFATVFGKVTSVGDRRARPMAETQESAGETA